MKIQNFTPHIIQTAQRVVYTNTLKLSRCLLRQIATNREQVLFRENVLCQKNLILISSDFFFNQPETSRQGKKIWMLQRHTYSMWFCVLWIPNPNINNFWFSNIIVPFGHQCSSWFISSICIFKSMWDTFKYIKNQSIPQIF